MFIWGLREWVSALTERAVAHASSNRMHMHRETSEGRVQLLPPGCMIARGANSCFRRPLRANCTTQSLTTHYAHDSYDALGESSGVPIKKIKDQSLRVTTARICQWSVWCCWWNLTDICHTFVVRYLSRYFLDYRGSTRRRGTRRSTATRTRPAMCLAAPVFTRDGEAAGASGRRKGNSGAPAATMHSRW